MKTVFTIIACFLIIGCGSKSNSLESRFKNYMKDSVVSQSFNDPESYEFVSLKMDTITNHKFERLSLLDDSLKILNIVRKIELDSLDGVTDARSLRSTSLNILETNILRHEKELSNPDYIYKVEGTISFRAKNKLGAKIINQTKLSYFPSRDKIETND
jgi:hypothetical protein